MLASGGTALVASLLAIGALGQSVQNTTNGPYVNYTTVTGYFLQDQTSTNTTGFDYTAVNFGLINQTYPGISSGNLTQWQQFAQQVQSLNANATRNTVYKVLFLGRHGEGFHNAAESYYGTPAWNCYWSELDGNATTNWADADLTSNGVNQALIANRFWKRQISEQKIPYPQSYYTSPLTRCLRTANLTFSDIPLPETKLFIPTVKEFFREGISTHTCDRRSNKTYIHNRFPSYAIEAGFTETDELWNANYAETGAAQDARSKTVLDSVFRADDSVYISVTSHSGEIASLLRVLGHRAFSLSTGAVIPVLVKARFETSGPAPSVSVARSSVAFCTNGPPVTSVATAAQGCVCSGKASSGGVSASVSRSRVSASASRSRIPASPSRSAVSSTAVSSRASSGASVSRPSATASVSKPVVTASSSKPSLTITSSSATSSSTKSTSSSAKRSSSTSSSARGYGYGYGYGYPSGYGDDDDDDDWEGGY